MDPQDHQPVTSSRVSSSPQIDYALLQQHFHLPISEVAKELGVCATVLKKLCRKHGIPRWPHRKIKSLNKLIAALEETKTETEEKNNKDFQNSVHYKKRNKKLLIIQQLLDLLIQESHQKLMDVLLIILESLVTE